MTDDDGWGLVGMAVQSSCGRQEVEEGVRAIVGRWGLEIGPRGGQDTCELCDLFYGALCLSDIIKAGWTPLHLAALLSTPPLISFLLTRGASPHAVTTRGLTPLDLVSGMSDKLDVVTLLENATSIGSSISSASRVPTDQPDKSERRQRMLHRRRQKAVTKMEGQGEEDRKSRLARSKEKWLTEWAKVVGVDAELLLPTPRSRAGRSSADSGLGWRGDEDLPGDDEEEEDDAEDEGIGDLTASVLDDPCMFRVTLTSFTGQRPQ